MYLFLFFMELKGCFDCSDMKNLIGEAVCRICQESFSTTITGMLICCCFDSNVYTVIKCKGKERLYLWMSFVKFLMWFCISNLMGSAHARKFVPLKLLNRLLFVCLLIVIGICLDVQENRMSSFMTNHIGKF